MEDVLEVYHRPHDSVRPLVCLDEFSKQLVAHANEPHAMQPGKPQRYDNEYVRHGSTTAFMIYAPLEGRREVRFGHEGRRTAIDYAHVLEFVATEMFPEAERIVLVEDNLNTHRDSSLYKAFAPEKARALAERFERHHSPKHGSWLNIAESEIAAMIRTSLPDRVSTVEEFQERLKFGTTRRNEAGCKTKWQFTSEDARIKLHHLYPSL